MNIRCEISGGLYNMVASLDRFPIVLFVGSDKVTGDALAPVCGSMLKKMKPSCFIYGSLEKPVNATNLIATVEFIKRMHSGHKILVVDASVGGECDVGKIKFINGGIRPGKAVGREFQTVGDIAIAGIVSHRDMKTNGICPVRLFDIYKMAEEITREIYLCARSFCAHPKHAKCAKTSTLAGIYM